MIKFSIIVCTYNPNKNNLLRLLNALSKFSEKEIFFEILLVDNESSYNIGLIDFVQKFVSNKSNNARVLIKENLGGYIDKTPFSYNASVLLEIDPSHEGFSNSFIRTSLIKN